MQNSFSGTLPAGTEGGTPAFLLLRTWGYHRKGKEEMEYDIILGWDISCKTGVSMKSESRLQSIISGRSR